MIVIDTNALILLIIGLIDPNLISTHKRTSIYTINDYNRLLTVVGRIENLVVLPNVWTETDNLLNNFKGDHRYLYFEQIRKIVKSSTEQYLQTTNILDEYYFISLGVTDSLLLQLSKDAKFLVTGDSSLSDYAQALGITVFDIVAERQKDFI